MTAKDISALAPNLGSVTSRPWLLLAHSVPATLTPLVSFKPASPTPGLSESEVLLAQSCPTVCNPMDCSPPGSSVHGVLQARILEWVAIPFCRGSSQLRDRIQVSHIGSDQNHPTEKEMQKGKLFEEVLQIAKERREKKGREKGKDILK